MNDNDILPVWDGSTASTRSISFKNLRTAVPYMETVVYEDPNLILTQSDGNQFTVNISDVLDIIGPDVEDNDLVIWDVNTSQFISAGANKDPSTGEITFDQTINVPAGSINVGASITLSEGGEELVVKSNATETKGFVLKADYDDDGSITPEYVDLRAEYNIDLQSSDPDILTDNPLNFSIIGAVTSPDIRQTNQVTFRAASAMPNVTARIVDTASGVVIRYVPNKAAWDNNEGGLDFIAGDNIVDFNSDEPSTTGVFNIGVLPFRLASGQQIDIEFRADTMALRGISPNIPYITQLVQDGSPNILATLSDADNISASYLNLNASYTDTAATTSGFVTNHQATATATTLTDAVFTAGVDGVSNPTVITNGSGIFSTGDLIQVSNTRVNDGLYEVEDHTSTTLTIRGVGTVSTVEDFTSTDFKFTTDSGNITKVNISVIRAGTGGLWETGSGSETGIVFTEVPNLNLPVSTTDQAFAVWDGTGGDSLTQSSQITLDSDNFIRFTPSVGGINQGLKFRDEIDTAKALFEWQDGNNRLYADSAGGYEVDSVGGLTLSSQQNVTLNATNDIDINSSDEVLIDSVAGMTLTSSSGTVLTDAATINTVRAGTDVLLDAAQELRLEADFNLLADIVGTALFNTGGGVVAQNSNANFEVFTFTNTGTDGGTTRFYARDSSPEGVLTGAGNSFCWVTTASTATENGLWFLDSATAASTPWVQIASVDMAESGVTSNSIPSIDGALALYSGTSGTEIEEAAFISSTNGSDLLMQPPTPTSVYGITFDSGASVITHNAQVKRLAVLADQGELNLSGESVIATASAGPITLTTTNGPINIGSVNGNVLIDSAANNITMSNVLDDVDYLVSLSQSGSFTGAMRVVTGSRNPIGNVTAAYDKLYFREGASSFETDIYLGEGLDTDAWAPLKGRGAPLQWGNNGVSSSTTTRYMTPGIRFGDGAVTTEANVQIPATRDGRVRNLAIRHNIPAGNGNDIVYRLRVNGVNTSLTVTLASTGTQASSGASDSFIINKGDLLSIQVTKTSGISSSPNNVTASLDFY